MPDSEGLLPSRPQPAIDDRGALPAVQPIVASIPAPVSIAAESPHPGRPEVVAVADTAAPRSLDERLAAVTATGGLRVLPADFGDPHGDWSTIRSDNPFTVLYLDSRQAHMVTPEMVAAHRELLQRFWQEKLRSMSQGAARVAIVKKYGGVDESERLVRSFPELIDRAYQQLATRSAIDATCSRIAAHNESVVCSRIDEKLDDFLVDLVLQPDEVRSLLEFGDREGVRRTTVADRIHMRLQTKGLVPQTEPAGWTLEAQLLSTVWVHPVRQQQPAVSPIPPRKKSLLVPLFIFSFVVVLVLLVAAALSTSTVTRSLPISRAEVATVSTNGERPASTTTSQTVMHEEVQSSPLPEVASVAAVSPGPTVVTTFQKVQPAPVVVSAEERGRVREELFAIRGLVESEPQKGLERIAILEQSLGTDFIEARVEAAQLRSELEKTLLRRQLALENERQKQEAEERAREERAREWEQRLAAVEELMRQPNYSGAKTLADQLLATPGIPEAVASRVTELRGQALAELQKIFSGAKVKSKTGRSPRGQQ